MLQNRSWHIHYDFSRLRDWSQREGYLELARREKEGLPLVDGNLIDPEKIELPSDEELGNFDIIVWIRSF